MNHLSSPQFAVNPLNTFVDIVGTCFSIGAHERPSYKLLNGQNSPTHGLYGCGDWAHFDSDNLSYKCVKCGSVISEEVLIKGREFRRKHFQDGGLLKSMTALVCALAIKSSPTSL